MSKFQPNRYEEVLPRSYNPITHHLAQSRPAADLPIKASSKPQPAANGKAAIDAPKVDDDARSHTPSRHHQKSQRAQSVHSNKAEEPKKSERGSDHGAMNVMAMGHGDAQLRSEHRKAPARDLREEKHEEKARNKTAELEKKATSESGAPVFDLANHQIGKVSKNLQPYVVVDKDGVSRCGTIYELVTDSQVSHPENLVCDNCVNKGTHDDKLKNAAEQKERDKEFANKVSDNMRKQLEDERQRQLEKLKVYQDAVDNQRKDQLQRKEADKLAQDAENEKIRKQLENKDDEIARLEKERLKRLNFIGDLKDQIDKKKDQDALKAANEKNDDLRNPNLLIDDGWRQPHREAMKEHYKNYLIDQVNEAEKNKDAEREKAKKEDEDYKRKLANLNADELKRLRDNEDQKRKIFMDEVQKQLQDKDKMKEFEDKIKAAEDDNYRKKLEADRQAYLDNIFKKKQQMDDYLNTLGKQIVDKDMEKRIKELEAKKRYNTTLCLGKKPTKCYNCAVCKNIYPLKMLNKKHRLA